MKQSCNFFQGWFQLIQSFIRMSIKTKNLNQINLYASSSSSSTMKSAYFCFLGIISIVGGAVSRTTLEDDCWRCLSYPEGRIFIVHANQTRDCITPSSYDSEAMVCTPLLAVACFAQPRYGCRGLNDLLRPVAMATQEYPCHSEATRPRIKCHSTPRTTTTTMPTSTPASSTPGTIFTSYFLPYLFFIYALFDYVYNTDLFYSLFKLTPSDSSMKPTY